MKAKEMDGSKRITIISEDGKETKTTIGKISKDREKVVIRKTNVPDWPIGHIVASINSNKVVSGSVESSKEDKFPMIVGPAIVFDVDNQV